MQKILIVYYSQSGQLEEIVAQFAAGLENTTVVIEKIKIEPIEPYHFPWTSERFFAAMPHSVLGIPTTLKAIKPAHSQYDLVVLGYQPWYLSPSIPTTSILMNDNLKKIIANTPVVTLIGARNMWINGQETVKKLLSQSQARLVGNIVLIDRHNNYASAISILQWMLSGKKERYKGIFPLPGISEKDICSAKTFGKIVAQHLETGTWENLQQQLVTSGAVEVNSTLMFVEQRAGKLFYLWAKLIETKTDKTMWLKIFKYYLIVALFIIAPVVLLLYRIFLKPFTHKSILRKKKYYLGLT